MLLVHILAEMVFPPKGLQEGLCQFIGVARPISLLCLLFGGAEQFGQSAESMNRVALSPELLT
jgi:hypothetical protein